MSEEEAGYYGEAAAHYAEPATEMRGVNDMSDQQYLLDLQRGRIEHLEAILVHHDDVSRHLMALIKAGSVPVLHYTPLRPGLTEDPYDPEPRWCCHDESMPPEELWHEHARTPLEAVAGLRALREKKAAQEG